MYTETTQVSFSGGVEVYGGFTGCTATSWTWSASMQAEIATVAGVPGVVLDGGANKLENVSVTAPNVPMTMPGGSSIALLVNGGSLDMTNGALTAGDAQDGAAGHVAGDGPDAGRRDRGQRRERVRLRRHASRGRWARRTRARHRRQLDRGQRRRRRGLDGQIRPGSGTNGSAMPAATPAGIDDGKGGAGEGQTQRSVCATGDPGAPGAAGDSGGGATGIGTLVEGRLPGRRRHGRHERHAGPGRRRRRRREGRAVSVMCGSGTMAVAGASGGAGGTGGCGGALGGGGQAGGSSIALLVLDAEVTLASVTLTAGKGGNGGGGR